jgi:hypothetical protein
MGEGVESLCSDLSTLIGEAGVVACDNSAGIITLVPLRIPSTPIVVQEFDDGWMAVMCGAGFYQEVSPDFGVPLVTGLIREIVEGRCVEYIVENDLGDWQITSGITLEDGSYSQQPLDGRRLVSWRHPAWAGDATTAEVKPL